MNRLHLLYRSLLTGVALAATSVAALAQSVTLYGVIDTGVEYMNGIGPARHSVTKVPNLTGTVPSRWGMRGTEELGGGLKSVFVLESGFAPDAGTSGQGNRLFGRQAYVGLADSWGQVAVGRQYTMLFWATLDADVFGPNVYGTGSLDSYLPNARADNAISYKGKFGGLTLGATYSFGRDSVNAGPSPVGTICAGENAADKRACREWSALVLYETSRFGVSAAYDSLRGGPGAFGGLTRSSLRDDRLSLGGYMLIDRAKLGAGWIRRDNRGSVTPRSDLWYAGALYDITPVINIGAQVNYLRFHDSGNKAVLYALRGVYSLSKRTSLYATAGYIDNGGQAAFSVSLNAAGATPGPGRGQFGTMLGIKHTF